MEVVVVQQRGRKLVVLFPLFIPHNDILGFRGVEKVGSIEVERDLFH